MTMTQKKPEGTINFCWTWSSKTERRYLLLYVLRYPENEGTQWCRTKFKLL